MLFGGTFRRKALEALLEGSGVPRQYRGPVAVAVNRFMEEFIMQPKAGWKTTEFWMSAFTVAGSVFATVQGIIPPDLAAKIGAVIAVGYNLARGLAKQTPASGAVIAAPVETTINTGK